jgi:16S rRNA (cytidine1402-2'-O)-methyltransferase
MKMKLMRIIPLLFYLAAFTDCSTSQQQTNETDPVNITAQAVLNRYIAAIGGRESFENMTDKTIVMSGTTGDQLISIMILQKKPDKLYQELQVGEIKQTIIYNGNKGKMIVGEEQIHIEEKELERLKYDAALHLTLDPEGYGIKTKLRSYHSYNLKTETPKLIGLLQQDKSIALISDAGTPGISDPGYQLVQACIENDIITIPIPGASALTAALPVSGLQINRFVFEGFLPHKKGRKTRLELLSLEDRTVVIYESPHRIEKTVNDLIKNFGDRQCVMARELTKKFEEIFRGQLSELKKRLEDKKAKGEIVLMIAAKST